MRLQTGVGFALGVLLGFLIPPLVARLTPVPKSVDARVQLLMQRLNELEPRTDKQRELAEELVKDVAEKEKQQRSQ